MPRIKFSHPYRKLQGNSGQLIDLCQLIQVVPINLADLTQEMRDYDTDNGVYELPVKGEYLMLIFMKPGSADLFTTMRRSTRDKLEYYYRMQGQTFDVVVTEILMETGQ